MIRVIVEADLTNHPKFIQLKSLVGHVAMVDVPGMFPTRFFPKPKNNSPMAFLTQKSPGSVWRLVGHEPRDRSKVMTIDRDRLRWSFRSSGVTQEQLAALARTSRAHLCEVLANKPDHDYRTRGKVTPHLTSHELQLLGWDADGSSTKNNVPNEVRES